jgi:polyribonucleotide nucleotidyltransferase
VVGQVKVHINDDKGECLEVHRNLNIKCYRICKPYKKVFERILGKIISMINNKTEEEWEKLQQKYKVEDKITGIVKKVERYGVFFDIDSVFDGLILIPCLRYPPVQTKEDYPKPGDKLEAVIIGFQGNAELEWRYVVLSILEKYLKSDLEWYPE